MLPWLIDLLQLVYNRLAHLFEGTHKAVCLSFKHFDFCLLIIAFQIKSVTNQKLQMKLYDILEYNGATFHGFHLMVLPIVLLKQSKRFELLNMFRWKRRRSPITI